MYPVLLHLYGPLSIHSYGAAIVVGLLLFTYLVLHHPQRAKLVSSEQLFDIMTVGIVAGLIGGRLLYVISEQHAESWTSLLFSLQGFSLLGSVIAIVASLAVYLQVHRIPALPFLDLVAIYAPLLQAAGRIGCFLAGCCYGAPASVWWAVTYTHPEVDAPLCMALHPSQLYSAGILVCIFLVLRFVIQHRVTKPGQLIGCYLMLMSAERFITDFFRFDHHQLVGQWGMSVYQWISLAIFAAAATLLFFISLTPARR